MATGGGSSWIAANADIIINIAKSLIPVERLVTGAAYVIGISFAFKAIFALKVVGESRTMMSGDKNLKEPLMYLFVAAIFIYFPTGLAVLLNTTFGSSSILAYAPIDSQSQILNSLFGKANVAGHALAIIIQVLGVIAFVRGWVLIARSSAHGQSQGGVGKGLVHVFGGILAMNIVLTLQIINNTLYGTS